MIRSTVYHTDKIPEIRKSALKDGKAKIDDYCNNLIATLNGSKIKIKDIRIQEESDWSNLSSGVYFSPPPVSESLQNVQLKKNVEIRLRLNIDVEVEM
jgi:hypothetical protein